jgi:hypothetical protein
MGVELVTVASPPSVCQDLADLVYEAYEPQLRRLRPGQGVYLSGGGVGARGDGDGPCPSGPPDAAAADGYAATRVAEPFPDQLRQAGAGVSIHSVPFCQCHARLGQRTRWVGGILCLCHDKALNVVR